MTQKKPGKLYDRVYHGWLGDRPVSVDRVLVKDGVAQVCDRLPWAPPKVGALFCGFAWGDSLSSYRAAKVADLAYSLLNDCCGVRDLSLRYAASFASQVLVSIGAHVPFQMLGSQVRVWLNNQIQSDGALGHSVGGSEAGSATYKFATYVCPVCGSLEFETAAREAGGWCHFYRMQNMILCDPLALSGDVHHLPPEMKIAATTADGFDWSDKAHETAGVNPADEFGPAARQIGGRR